MKFSEFLIILFFLAVIVFAVCKVHGIVTSDLPLWAKLVLLGG